jgi:hypothetical protein
MSVLLTVPLKRDAEVVAVRRRKERRSCMFGYFVELVGHNLLDVVALN